MCVRTHENIIYPKMCINGLKLDKRVTVNKFNFSCYLNQQSNFNVDRLSDGLYIKCSNKRWQLGASLSPVTPVFHTGVTVLNL